MSDTLRIFDGAIALVTGGASGIGAALGRALVARGATVVLADRQADEAAQVVRTLGAQATSAALDVRDAAAVEALIADVWGRHGRLDFLFNNAGTTIGGEVKDLTLVDWHDVLDVNLMGVIHGIQFAYPRMVEQGFGHIINTASLAGHMALPGAAPYGASKHAVVGLSRALRIEARRYGVRVSVLCPGAVRTPILINGGRYGRMRASVSREQQIAFWKKAHPAEPAPFAEIVLRRVASNQAIIVEPAAWRVLWWINRLSPTVGDWLVRRSFEQLLKQWSAGDPQNQR